MSRCAFGNFEFDGERLTLSRQGAPVPIGVRALTLLGALLACMRHLAGRRGDLRLCNLSAPVQALFELMRMHRILNVQPTRDDAVRSYALA